MTGRNGGVFLLEESDRVPHKREDVRRTTIGSDKTLSDVKLVVHEYICSRVGKIKLNVWLIDTVNR